MVDLEHLFWRLRHPSVRRCPRCRTDWEPKRIMRTQGGVCQDCWSRDIDSISNALVGEGPLADRPPSDADVAYATGIARERGWLDGANPTAKD